MELSRLQSRPSASLGFGFGVYGQGFRLKTEDSMLQSRGVSGIFFEGAP